MLDYKIRKLLFHKIGGKIKTLAMVIAIIGMGASLIFGFIMMIEESGHHYGGDSTEVVGFTLIIVGSLLSWIASCFLYGFGELIEKICGIYEMMEWKLNQESLQGGIQRIKQLRFRNLEKAESFSYIIHRSIPNISRCAG